MQGLKLCVWVIFIFGQPQQIVRGYAIEIRQRRDRKRADILVVIGFIFSQCRFGQTGLLRQLFQRQGRSLRRSWSRSGIVSFAYIQSPLPIFLFRYYLHDNTIP